MQKIMFNDRYGLTEAVIEGRKTMTRRLINLNSASSDVQVRIFAGYVQIIGRSGNVCAEKKLPYKVGEIVAVAQSYEQVDPQIVHFRTDDLGDMIGDHPGQSNKMFVKAELMPHQIRITGILVERLQDISDEDCMKEGVIKVLDAFGNPSGYYTALAGTTEFALRMYASSPREAFALLIDRVSGKGTWKNNPWVVAYEFELLK